MRSADSENFPARLCGGRLLYRSGKGQVEWGGRPGLRRSGTPSGSASGRVGGREEARPWAARTVEGVLRKGRLLGTVADEDVDAEGRGANHALAAERELHRPAWRRDAQPKDNVGVTLAREGRALVERKREGHLGGREAGGEGEGQAMMQHAA